MSCWNKLKSSHWAYPTTLVCLYGFISNCRVAEPFLTPYLIGPHRNISEEVVTNYLFPIWTYSYMSFLLPVFLLTDFLKYKPVIVVQGFFQVFDYVLLCFVPGLAAMICLQINYGIITSTEVAYFSYIYSVIPKENFQKATSYIHASTLAGVTLSSFLGQILVSLAGLDYYYLNIITLGIEIMALLIAFCLPMPKTSLFFIATQTNTSPTEKDNLVHEGATKWCNKKHVTRAGHILWQSFKQSYSSSKFICCSLWWAFATAGYMQIYNYIQLLWEHIEPSATSSVYNGAVEAGGYLAGAAAAFCVGYINVRWAVWGELIIGLFSTLGAGAVILMALSNNIWVCYACWVIFEACHELINTIAVFQVASNLSMDFYALTFGINTFGSVLLQTILTVVVVDDTALGLDIVTQYVIYGSYYAVISVLCLMYGTYTLCTRPKSSQNNVSDSGVHNISEEQF